MADNYICEMCSKKAVAFSLNVANKVQVCEQHVMMMIEKALPIFPIEAFNFVKAPCDFTEFTRRRQEKTKIETYVQRLIISVTEEKQNLLQELTINQALVNQVVTQTYETMKNKVEVRYAEVMLRLKELSTESALFIQSSEAKMSASAKLIKDTESQYLPRLLQFTIGNQSLEAAKAVMQRFDREQESVHSILTVLNAAKQKSLIEATSASVADMLRNPQRETGQYAVCLSSELVKMGVSGGAHLYQESCFALKRVNFRAELEVGIFLGTNRKALKGLIANFDEREAAGQRHEQSLRECAYQYSVAKMHMNQRQYIEAESLLLQVEHFVCLHFPASPMRACVYATLARLYENVHMQEAAQDYMCLFNEQQVEHQRDYDFPSINLADNIPPEFVLIGEQRVETRENDHYMSGRQQKCKWVLEFVLIGPRGTPYDGGIFDIDIKVKCGKRSFWDFGPRHRVLFKTAIYHPNITKNKKIQMKGEVEGDLISIRKLLTDPYIPADDATGSISEPAKLYKTNKAEFDSTAREWTRKYAMSPSH